MPSITSSSLSIWIVVAFCVVCIGTILIATKGSGFRTFWQLIKIDQLVRNTYLVWGVIILAQFVNVLFSSPWKGVFVLVGTCLDLVMIVLISYILPRRLHGDIRTSMMEASTSKQKSPLD